MSESYTPKVSICIPARNEEIVIERCVKSVLNQNYNNFEVWVLDDGSDDQTPNILSRLKENHSSLNVIKGETKPTDWLGKPWACNQLSKRAEGDILVFIDADTWWEPNALGCIVQSFKQHKLDALTVWPEQRFKGFWEATIVPMVYHALCSLLPVDFVHKLPSWIPPSLSKKLAPSFSAACGQCIAFSRECYEGIRGHESVKQQVVEDVELAKNIRSSGFVINMYNGIELIYCRMYTSQSEIWNGFRKNFLAGFNNNLALFLLSSILHLIVYISPVSGLIYALYTSDTSLLVKSTIALILILLHRAILSAMFKWRLSFSFTHILGVLWFQLLGLRCIYDYLFKREVSWKGRNI